MKAIQKSPLLESIADLPPPASGHSRLALINQAAFADCRKIIARLDVFDRYALLNQQVDACEDSATPFLIPIQRLSASQSSAWKKLCDQACYANAISVIDTAVSPALLAEALTLRCEATLSDGQSVILRFFDTRIVEPLIEALDEEQRRQFFSCASAWWYASRNGLMKSISDCGAPMEQAAILLRLSVSQTRTLRDASEADGIVDLLMKAGSVRLAETPYSSRHNVVVTALEKGRHLGLTSRQDLVAYCSLSLEIDADGLDSPPWKGLLGRVQNGELAFFDALEIAEAEADA